MKEEIEGFLVAQVANCHVSWARERMQRFVQPCVDLWSTGTVSGP